MIDIAVTPELVVGALAALLALVALVVAVPAWRKVRRVDRLVVAADAEGAGVAATMVRHDDLLRELRSDLLVVHDNTQLLRRLVRDTISHVGLVRYDAFQDLTGAMSFSLAMLDEQGDGVVITSIAGRNDSRMYAKNITGGRCGPTITEEERAAVERAVADKSDAVEIESTASARRRRAS